MTCCNVWDRFYNYFISHTYYDRSKKSDSTKNLADANDMEGTNAAVEVPTGKDNAGMDVYRF